MEDYIDGERDCTDHASAQQAASPVSKKRGATKPMITLPCRSRLCKSH
jgi:hypothetical protein